MRNIFVSLVVCFSLLLSGCTTSGSTWSPSSARSSQPPANLLQEKEILATQKDGEIWFAEDGSIVPPSHFVAPGTQLPPQDNTQPDIQVAQVNPNGMVEPNIIKDGEDMLMQSQQMRYQQPVIPPSAQVPAPQPQYQVDPVTGQKYQIPVDSVYVHNNQVVQGKVMPYKALKTVSKVKVAMLLPLSGEHGKIGKSILNSAQLALFDIAGDHFELMPRDTKGTPEGAMDAAQSAVNDGAQLILGPLFSANAKAIKPIAKSANVKIITFSTDWTLADYNTYVMGFTPFDQVQRVMGFAVSQGKKNQAILAPYSEYGDAVSAAFKQAARRVDANAVMEERYRVGDENFNDLIRKFSQYDERKINHGARIAELEAIPARKRTSHERNELARLKIQSTAGELPFDAILLPMGGTEVKAVTSILKYYDVDLTKARFLGTGLWDDASLSGEISMHGGWYAAPSPQNREGFVNQYKSVYGQTPPRIASLGYDATALAAVLSRQAIAQGRSEYFPRDAITNPNGFAGIDGIFRFTSNGLAERGLAVLEITPTGSAVISPAPVTFQEPTN